MSEWISWAGGRCPVAVGTKVDVERRHGMRYYGVPAGGIYADRWEHSMDAHSLSRAEDIVAYRASAEETLSTPSRLVAGAHFDTNGGDAWVGGDSNATGAVFERDDAGGITVSVGCLSEYISYTVTNDEARSLLVWLQENLQ